MRLPRRVRSAIWPLWGMPPEYDDLMAQAEAELARVREQYPDLGVQPGAEPPAPQRPDKLTGHRLLDL